jgi:DNA polymerase-3 subunit alpha (Gram-positive type)
MTKLISNGVDTQVAFNTMESVRKGKGIQKNELDIIKQHNIPD